MDTDIIGGLVVCDQCGQANPVGMQCLHNNKIKISVPDVDGLEKGVWFKSSLTGHLYRNHKSAGDIDCVMIDGVWFDKSNK